jgi:hypothetical protein
LALRSFESASQVRNSYVRLLFFKISSYGIFIGVSHAIALAMGGASSNCFQQKCAFKTKAVNFDADFLYLPSIKGQSTKNIDLEFEFGQQNLKCDSSLL